LVAVLGFLALLGGVFVAIIAVNRLTAPPGMAPSNVSRPPAVTQWQPKRTSPDQYGTRRADRHWRPESFVYKTPAANVGHARLRSDYKPWTHQYQPASGDVVAGGSVKGLSPRRMAGMFSSAPYAMQQQRPEDYVPSSTDQPRSSIPSFRSRLPVSIPARTVVPLHHTRCEVP